MKQQKGFTLIELIIVIVILGILAVTAAPRFFDFSKDARESTLGGLKAALQGAAQIEYAAKAIAGSPGYPTASEIVADAGITAGDWDIAITPSNVARFAPKGLTGNVASTSAHTTITVCYVEYDSSSADADTPPIIKSYTTGC